MPLSRGSLRCVGPPWSKSGSANYGTGVHQTIVEDLLILFIPLQFLCYASRIKYIIQFIITRICI